MLKNEFICDCNVIHKEVVDDVKGKMPTTKTFESLANLFKILGDNTRIKILFSLSENEMCVCDIANLLGMTKSSISHQLSTLRKNKIVKYRRDAKQVYYSLDDEHICQLFLIGLEHIHHQEGENL